MGLTSAQVKGRIKIIASKNGADPRVLMRIYMMERFLERVSFIIKDVETIMDEMEYPGIRFHLDAIFERMITPIKIDVSTGDVITPQAIEYNYKLMLEEREIELWSYNLETILGEKLQTILVRERANTRILVADVAMLPFSLMNA